jgi:4-hydroxy-2-oxoheptanedioate aldolase
VEAAGAIAEVDGVDAVVVGCADLALDLGEAPGELGGRLRDAIASVQDACAAAATHCGVAGPDDPSRLSELSAGRSSLLVLGADVRIYARALRDSLTRLCDQSAHDAPEREEAHVRT